MSKPHPDGPISPTPTAYMVRCPECGPSYLTEHEYERQMNRPDSLWQCPKCGEAAPWDDENFEKHNYGEPHA